VSVERINEKTGGVGGVFSRFRPVYTGRCLRSRVMMVFLVTFWAETRNLPPQAMLLAAGFVFWGCGAHVDGH